MYTTVNDGGGGNSGCNSYGKSDGNSGYVKLLFIYIIVSKSNHIIIDRLNPDKTAETINALLLVDLIIIIFPYIYIFIAQCIP